MAVWGQDVVLEVVEKGSVTLKCEGGRLNHGCVKDWLSLSDGVS